MDDKIYVGSGKKVGNYDIVNISIAEDKVQDHWFEYNGKRYLRLTVGSKKQPNEYGKTHNVWIDNYKPEQKQQAQPQTATAQAGDGLPF